jgi:anti-anti-sigma regulatory factor
MIRITIDTTKGVRLVVEGHLRGLAVEELRKTCAGRYEAGIVLDLSGVVFADRSAAKLLKELSAAGFTPEGCSDFIKELLAKR